MSELEESIIGELVFEAVTTKKGDKRKKNLKNYTTGRSKKKKNLGCYLLRIAF